MKKPRKPKKPRRRRREPRARRVRIKVRKGPVQLLLPLQMPLALGVEAFAERPAAFVDDDGPAPVRAPAGEQRGLW